MSTLQQHRLIGQVIAERYRVDGLLGEGGMGAVYIAEHLTLHKQVALKIVHPELAGNAEIAARFAQEAMVTSRIDHPNVISAMDYGTLGDGTSYLAVQLVRGPSLRRVLDLERRLPWPRATELAAQIADALSAAHAQGVVHRDLKPDNVLLQALDDGGELVKILDFGVAKIASEIHFPDHENRQITQLGLVIGTPGYMAPEQAIGSSADHRSDLYSLGVMLWECLTGRMLWEGDDLQALVEKQLAHTAPSLSDGAPDLTLPPALSEIVAQLLSRRGEGRPHDAAEVRDRLRGIVVMEEAETSRWRTGSWRLAARPSTESGSVEIAVAPLSSPVALPQALAPMTPAAQLMSGATPTATPTERSSRPAWLLTLLVTTILAVAAGLVITGQLQIRPQGDAAQVAAQVAKQLRLPEPLVAAMRSLPAPEATSAAKPGEVSPSLQAAFDQLVNAEARELRVDAANKLLGHVPISEVPAYVRRMAYMQLATTCAAKRAELREMSSLRDPRVLPMLLELDGRPPNGCGKRKREDCLACLREPLDKLLRELKESSAATGSGGTP